MNTNLFEDLAGIPVTGNLEGRYPDVETDARRVPASIVIDISGSMREYADLLLEAVVKLIEQLAEDPIAKARIDLQIMTFNTKEQVKIRIPFQELELLVDENNKLLDSYKTQLVFDCDDGTPTGYALAAVVASLRRRYNLLKNAGKSPFSPVLFFLSDGRPEVYPNEQQAHDEALEMALKDIRTLVSEDRLSCISVEVGDICKMKDDPERSDEYEEMHQLMKAISGLDNEHHVCQAAEGSDLAQFFQFTETLLRASSTGSIKLNDIDVNNVKLN